MHFFGLWGTISFLLGIGITLYLVISKFTFPSYPLTNRPAFYLALTAIIIGMQLFLAGFISELIARNAPGRNSYLIEDKIRL
jgi:hypothetical protein